MNGDDLADDMIVTLRPPAPEIPPEVRSWQEKQNIFHSQHPRSSPLPSGGGWRDHEPIPDSGSGIVPRQDVCVLNERGGHLQLGLHCPHGLGYSDDTTYEVEM